jgi:hypothetical protein
MPRPISDARERGEPVVASGAPSSELTGRMPDRQGMWRICSGDTGIML